MLFEECVVGSLKLKNRFVRSATWEGLADDEGRVTPRLMEKMVELAEGGVGLIITGHAFVSPEGRAGNHQLAVYDDAFVEGLREMTETVHHVGGSIVLQIAHAGAFASVSPPRRAIAPSSMRNAREMSVEEIERVVECFGEAARRARDAGFDGVQIHAAHGYLLSQFLSPAFNRRTDAYGGTTEGRATVVIAVLRAIRSRVGADMPVLMKINSEDFLDGGLSLRAMVDTVAMLEREGLDAVELSGGTLLSGAFVPVRPHRRTSEPAERLPPYYLDAARRLKDAVRIPVILVGGIRSYEVAEAVVREGGADLVAMSRPFIREPSLVRRWERGDRRPALCISDNLCFKPAMKGEGIYCVRERHGAGEAPQQG